jgi:conjugal transfer/entry exclusion protein
METVTEKRVLTQEELQTIQNIQDDTQNLVFELGEIEMILIQMEDRKSKAKQYLTELSQRERDFNNTIIQKYGKVTLDSQTGEIFPSE